MDKGIIWLSGGGDLLVWDICTVGNASDYPQHRGSVRQGNCNERSPCFSCLGFSADGLSDRAFEIWPRCRTLNYTYRTSLDFRFYWVRRWRDKRIWRVRRFCRLALTCLLEEYVIKCGLYSWCKIENQKITSVFYVDKNPFFHSYFARTTLCWLGILFFNVTSRQTQITCVPIVFHHVIFTLDCL